MITLGIVLLVVGIICWVFGAILAPRPPSGALVVIGQGIGAIGVVVLLIGVLVLVLHGADNPELDVDGLGLLVLG